MLKVLGITSCGVVGCGVVGYVLYHDFIQVPQRRKQFLEKYESDCWDNFYRNRKAYTKVEVKNLKHQFNLDEFRKQLPTIILNKDDNIKYKDSVVTIISKQVFVESIGEWYRSELSFTRYNISASKRWVRDPSFQYYLSEFYFEHASGTQESFKMLINGYDYKKEIHSMLDYNRMLLLMDQFDLDIKSITFDNVE